MSSFKIISTANVTVVLQIFFVLCITIAQNTNPVSLKQVPASYTDISLLRVLVFRFLIILSQTLRRFAFKIMEKMHYTPFLNVNT